MAFLNALRDLLKDDGEGALEFEGMSEAQIEIFDEVRAALKDKADKEREVEIYRKGIECAVNHYQQTMRNLSAFKRTSELLADGLDVQAICHKALKILASELNIENCSIFFPDEVARGLYFKAGMMKKRIREDYLELANLRFNYGEGVLGSVALEKKTVIIEDTSKDIRFVSKPMNVQVGSLLCLPMLSAGELVGVINLSHPRKNFFNPGHVNVYSIFSDVLAQMITFAKLDEELQKLNANLEHRVEERTREIEAYQRSLEGVLVNSRDHIYATDMAGRVTFVNPKALELGYDCHDLIGKPLTFLLDRGAGVKEVEESFRGRGKDDFRTVFRHKDGSPREIIMNTIPLSDKDEMRGYLVTARDVTEKKYLERKLLRAEKLASIGELASGVAHELNNKLVPVLAYADLMTDTVTDEKDLKMLHKIKESAIGAKKVIQSLLKFSRQEKLEKGPVNVNALISDAVEVYGWKFKSECIEVTLNLSPEIPVTVADGQQLQQVFINIIKNARQAMGAEGGTLTVETRPVGGRYIEMEFTDDGPGIPKEIADKIFDPFFTTKDVGEGTGLGLSICYGIIEEHGGEITVTSRPGKTAFVIRLPIRRPEMAAFTASAAGMSAQADPREDSGPCGKRLLVIDDEMEQLELLTEVLSGKFEVMTANTGSAAFTLLQTGEFDAVLTDVRMPGINGMAVLGWIGKHRPELRDRVVFMTGDTCEPTVQKFIEENSVPSITKPYDIANLFRTIDEVISYSYQTAPE
jgi:two-component system NtrC family sensor kinase